jgi:uncharacterized lipoprotein NlpE involved in copper resistance
MRKAFFVGTVLLVFLVWSCAKQAKPKPVPAADSFASIAGDYKGILPCANCEGIDTLIRLRSDGTYIFQIRYLGKSDEVFEWTENFKLNPQTNVLTLEAKDEYDFPPFYAVGENTLTQLDMEGEVITGELAELYILKKQ